MRIALSLALVAVLAAACSKKEEAAKAPEAAAPAAPAAPALAAADLAHGVFVVNVFASWCAPCRLEHPRLLELAADRRIRLVGINYKDTDDQARRFLGALGNPYAAVGADRGGRVGIDWGVYGVPETYVVADGRIAFKHVGPLSADSIATVLRPEIDKALAAAGPAQAAP